MQFSIDIMFARDLGTAGKTWPRVQEWKAKCEATDSFRRAKEKTGYVQASVPATPLGCLGYW